MVCSADVSLCKVTRRKWKITRYRPNTHLTLPCFCKPCYFDNRGETYINAWHKIDWYYTEMTAQSQSGSSSRWLKTKHRRNQLNSPSIKITPPISTWALCLTAQLTHFLFKLSSQGVWAKFAGFRIWWQNWNSKHNHCRYTGSYKQRGVDDRLLGDVPWH